MNEEIKEKLDLNPNNMNGIAKEAYYKLENYIFTLEKTQNNWNELKKYLLIGRQESNWVQGDMFWSEACNSILSKMQELEQGKDE